MMYAGAWGGLTMRRTNIYLEEEKLVILKMLAAEEGKTVAELVRKAVNQWLDERLTHQKDWGQRLDELVNRVRSGIPADSQPEDIESDISAARAEIQQ
jgi:hypothetical protein